MSIEQHYPKPRHRYSEKSKRADPTPPVSEPEVSTPPAQNPTINAWEELCTFYTGREIQEEDYWLSMRKECDAIVKNKYDIQSSYQAARVLLYKTLLEERNNLEQDCSTSRKVDVNIRKAGEMLYASGGMNYMHDPLLWSFIPRHIRRHIDYIWSGIGDWLA